MRLVDIVHHLVTIRNLADSQSAWNGIGQLYNNLAQKRWRTKLARCRVCPGCGLLTVGLVGLICTQILNLYYIYIFTLQYETIRLAVENL